MEREIKHTSRGFSYIDVNIMDCLKWGGLGICDGCGTPHKELKLIWVLRDTYCNECFKDWLKRSENYTKEDVEYDLNLQRDNDLKWYKMHGVI